MMDQSILLFRTKTIIFVLFLFLVVSIVSGNGVFKVQHKFGGRHHRSLSALKAHDTHRHGRIHGRVLSEIDIALGGDSHPTETGLYFGRIVIGTPSNVYYVQVDTGSDILWVNCVECDKCPKKSDIMGGIKLSLYNVKASSTGKSLTCDEEFCSNIYDGSYPGCAPNKACEYRVVYGDGSQSDGYYVRDNVYYHQVSGNSQTSPGNASVVFGCGAKQSGGDGSSTALDGILGFGQSNSSMISQLAASGKLTRKMFSHCLDGGDGGGIFAIGEVVEPKVTTTPLIPNQPHYNINLLGIKVGNESVEFPMDIIGFVTGSKKGAIIDSGTTLAYIPADIYDPFMRLVLVNHNNLKYETVQGQVKCFKFNGKVDENFPTVTFEFEGSLTLTVHPHEYLFENGGDEWCIGWQVSELDTKDGKEMILLGDLALTNKLIVYDLENQTIGWTDYNCSSSIKLKDETGKATYTVDFHNLSSASRLMDIRSVLILLFLSAMSHKFIS